MKKSHDIRELSLEGTHLYMLVDGCECDVDLSKESYLLANATETELKGVKVSPSGYGLYWPDLDEDLSVDGLMQNRVEPHLMVAESCEEYVAKSGFTLLEVLVAMGILMMIVLMMSTLFHQSNMAWNSGMRQAEMSIQARSAMSLMRRDLSQAVAFGGYGGDYECDIVDGDAGFAVCTLVNSEGDIRTLKLVSYDLSGSKISRRSQVLRRNNVVGDYGTYDGQDGGDLLDSVTDFKIGTPNNGNYSTNLPAWVDISITLSKNTAGAAGIKVWSLGRNNSDNAVRIENAKRKKLHTGDGSWL